VSKPIEEEIADSCAVIQETLAHIRDIMYELKEQVVQNTPDKGVDRLICPKCDVFFCEHQKP
jgi:hypothetical protein